MKPPERGSAHVIQLKIRLAEALRRLLAINAVGKPLNRAIVERLGTGPHFSEVLVRPLDPEIRPFLYNAAVKALAAQEWRLAAQYRDLNAVIRAMLRVESILAPPSTSLRPVRPGSVAARYLEGARDKIRRALDIVEGLPDQTTMDAETETAVEPLPGRQSVKIFFTLTNRSQTPIELVPDEQQRSRLQDERDPGNIVEVKIRLPEMLRHQLAADAARNKRTLTAEIRAQLELSCTMELFERSVEREMAQIVNAATENVLSLRQWRLALTTDKLYAVIDALQTAQGILNPPNGFLRRTSSRSAAARQLEDARTQIRSALAILDRLPEEPAAPTDRGQDTGEAASPQGPSTAPSGSAKSSKSSK